MRPILLVEDNPDDEALARRAFQKGRVVNELHVARDGAAALEYLNTQDLPQVVLLDLKLPKVDGHEVLRQIRANPKTKYLPVIILTSSKEERDLVAGYEGGANSYIVKPVDSAQFAECIRQLGLYWLVMNQTPDGTSQ